MITMRVKLKNGEVVTGEKFEFEDLVFIKNIFKMWNEMNNDLKRLGGRSMNVPDVVSEGLYSIFFDAVRTKLGAYSYDCVDINTGEGIQVKSTSIDKDLTSFGPKTIWDKLYFMDFAPNGIVDGNVYFYHIEEEIKSIVLNKNKNETFEDQQRQGRRPRLSIKDKIINVYGLEPIKKINLLD